MARYKLKHGEHRVPNPDFKEGDDPLTSHKIAQAGDYVELNESQYNAFRDKFEPAESEASSTRDASDEQLEKAKQHAAKTGQTTNPNQPIPQSPSTTPRGGSQ